MSGGRSFQGSTGAGAPAGRRVVALGAALLLFLGLLIAKPWGVPASPEPVPTPPGPSLAPPGSVPPDLAGSPGTSIPSTLGPSPPLGGFITPTPPDATAPWSALSWRRLTRDPLALVTSVIRWRGGFVAIGSVEGGYPLTPVWTSTDGARWALLPFNTSTGFWPDAQILGVVETPTGLVALTETGRDCTSGPCSPVYVPPAVAWTSPDGLAWAPHEALPTEWLSNPAERPPLLAVGPAGVVAATRGPAARIAVSTDGVDWERMPASTLPATFRLKDLRGISSGYVAVGTWLTSDTHGDAASLWSADGRRWSRAPTLLPTSDGLGSFVATGVGSLVAGRDGLVAVGDPTTDGVVPWWQSADGQHWQVLPRFDPVKSTSCTSVRCGLHPDGTLLGDGRRLLAVGFGETGAWESSDGEWWHQLESTGEIPGRAIAQALLPGGVLVSDGSTTWFGEAVVR